MPFIWVSWRHTWSIHVALFHKLLSAFSLKPFFVNCFQIFSTFKSFNFYFFPAKKYCCFDRANSDAFCRQNISSTCHFVNLKKWVSTSVKEPNKVSRKELAYLGTHNGARIVSSLKTCLLKSSFLWLTKRQVD